MKTVNRTTLLPALLVGIICFTLGCQQQVTDSSNALTKVVTENKPVKLDDTDTPSEANTPSDTNTSEDNTAEETTAAETTAAETTEQVVQPETSSTNEGDKPAEPTIDIPATWKQLSQTQEVWIDNKNKQVIVGGKVCLNNGPLEMLICPKGTKEHESIVSVNAESWQIHAALVALGASPGTPSRWDPEYTPAWGPSIQIEMMWRDEKTQQVKTIDGKQWILDTNTGKPMTVDLVFGGSYSEPQFEGEQPRYQANDGELICLANFTTSAIDIRVDKNNIDIFFEANTPLIPPANTQVYTIIKPGPVLGKPEE